MGVGRQFAAAVYGAVLILNAALSGAAAGQSSLIPLPNRRDAVFDHRSQFLYISTSDGLVEQYNIGSNQLESAFNLGGKPRGIDISPDDSCLIVTQESVAEQSDNTLIGTLHRIDLASGAITNITYPLFQPLRESSGGYEVGITADGHAFFTPEYGPYRSSGAAPLREMSLADNSIVTRGDAPGSYPGVGVSERAQLTRSANGDRLYIVQSGISSGPVFTYDATKDSFSKSASTGEEFGGPSGAVNRDGTRVATILGFSYTKPDLYIAIDDANDLSYRRSIACPALFITFDPLSDILYAVTGGATSQIIAYDSSTSVEKFRIDVGESLPSPQQLQEYNFSSHAITISDDGVWLALQTPSGIRIFDLRSVGKHAPVERVLAARDMVFDNSGRFLYVSGADGGVWRYNLVTNRMEERFELGGSLRGLDISQDDSFLIVAQARHGTSQGAFEKFDLRDGSVSLLPYSRFDFDGGSSDVAITSNGLAFLTTLNNGGSIQFMQLSLATNVMSERSESGAPGESLSFNAKLEHSADRRTVFVLGANGNSFVYNADTDTFVRRTNGHLYEYDTLGAVNRDGSLLATQLAATTTLESVTDASSKQSLYLGDRGVAFSPVTNILYGVLGDVAAVAVYDITTSTILPNLQIGETAAPLPYTYVSQFGPGTIVADALGHYLAVATRSGGVRVLGLANHTSARVPTNLGTHPQVLNLSTRMHIHTGDNVLIGGFISAGSTATQVIVRALGPSLQAAGVTGWLANPTIELRDGAGQLIASNDNWKTNDQTGLSQESDIEDSDLQPSSSLESALIASVEPGAAYTVIVRGKGNTSGIGLFEVYQLNSTAESGLANLSTRGLVESGDGVMIGGLIVGGAEGQSNVAIRALGPSLASAGVQNPLPDPMLELRDGQGTLISSNDDWKISDQALVSQESEVRATNLSPSDDREAFIPIGLGPGAYTAIVRGKAGTTGTALMEIYRLP